MGTQITIEIKDLEEAGWKCKIEEKMLLDWDDVEIPYYFLVISKDNYNFASYCQDCFFADCNAWGSNIHRFKEAGLLDVKHILG